MKKKLASIIVTNYNKEKYLKKSVTSLVSQSYSKKEIIIYDDSSTDNSINIIQKFKSIKLIKDENFTIDRSLNSDKFKTATGYTPSAWPELIRLMHSYQ